MKASEAPRLDCPHYLVARVRDILTGDCGVESCELAQILKCIGSASLSLRDDAKKLFEDVMKKDDVNGSGDTTRKDLAAVLEMLLADRSDVKRMHRKAKAFAFGLHVDAMKALGGRNRHSPEERMTFSLDQLDDLLQQALLYGSIGDYPVNDSVTAMQVLENVSSNIASTDVAKSQNEIHGEKAKKRLMKARQKIDKFSFEMTWVVMEDVIDQVKAEGCTIQADVDKRAQWIWNDACFPLEIYHTAKGVEATQAEFMREWLESGSSWEDAKTRLKKLRLSPGKKRALSPTFREAALKRLRKNAAITYTPKRVTR